MTATSPSEHGVAPIPITDPPKRVVEVDIARGLTVIGVVFNHGVDGLTSSGLLASGAIADANSTMYLFRMASLVFLIGLFVPSGVIRYGTSGYIRRRLRLLIYLYLLWFVIQTSVEVATSGVKNHPRDPLSLLRPWETFNQLWFLPMLAVATAVVVLTAPWASRWRALTTFFGAAGLATVTWGWNVSVVGGHGLSLIVFAMAGATIGLVRLAKLLKQGAAWWMAAAAVGLPVLLIMRWLGAVPPSVGHTHLPLITVVYSAIAAGCGIVVVLALSVALARVPGARGALSFIGRYTLPIFLAHVIVIAGVRVMLTTSGWTDPIFVLAVGTTFGVAAPLIFGWYARGHVWTSWLFDIPACSRGESSARQSAIAMNSSGAD